ncbi:hypothetical protein AB0J74_18090 [Asanoa sp. NPDC049573]|uniref:DUF305 domain-containing protein n=1 Tax=Asanoa sp. NPDC049573 TaxID=3155396 RepID=UPI00343E6624
MLTCPRLVLAAAAAALLSGVAGCAKQQPATPVTFGGTDRAWIEITIAMDEQVRPLLDLVPAHSTDPTLRAAAEQVRSLVDAELPTLRRLHDQAGLSPANPHTGMEMPGLVTATQLAHAATLYGREFDAFTAAALRGFLKHGADLARSETENGAEAQTKALAATATRVRARALSALPPGAARQPAARSASMTASSTP